MQKDSKIKLLGYKVARYFIPDSIFIRLKYKKAFGIWPNLKNPKTFNEKLTWLKLNDHNPVYTRMVDKYEAKMYVAERIGEEYIIPTLGVWDRAEDIDFDSLPDQFVLKATHDSGRVIICKDKSKLDQKKAVEDMRMSLQRDFYAVTREWPYKNVKPRIIAESFLKSGNDLVEDGLHDYKFFCFNGQVKFMKIDFNRTTKHRANYFDKHFRLLSFGEVVCPPDYKRELVKPLNFDKMVRLATELSTGHKFLRVDFYENDYKVYFGELTFYPASGTGPFIPEDADEEIGKLLNLNL